MAVPPLGRFLGASDSRPARPGCRSMPSAALGAGFTLGAFNPTGLGSKHGVVAQLEPGIYAVTETHLTSRGVQNFSTGLKFAGAPFTFFHGQPAPPRQRSSVTGSYTGVGFLSSFPGRAVACNWPPEVYQTARVQVASFLLNDVWILGGVCYGFATDKGRTSPILDAVIDRVLAQPARPALCCGRLEPPDARITSSTPPDFAGLHRNPRLASRSSRHPSGAHLQRLHKERLCLDFA